MNKIKLIISSIIKFFRKILFNFRKIKNRNSIWNVYKFNSYQQYVDFQKEKTMDPLKRNKWLNDEWNTKLEYFKIFFDKLLSKYKLPKNIKTVCLGARTGQEVQALIDLGYNDSIGTDLVESLPLVIEDDVHNMQFESKTFDLIFTNIVDHVLYPKKFINEVERVAKKNCLIVFHLTIGKSTDKYGVTEISKIESIIELFKKSKLIENNNIKEWHGMNCEIILQKK